MELSWATYRINAGSSEAHDQEPGTPCRNAGSRVVSLVTGVEPTQPIPLRAALEKLRLDGAIFFRAEFTESWSFESPLTEITALLRPGAKRMILFHIVAAGRCWISLADGEKHWANQGDVIVLPYGDDYLMGGAEPADSVPILTLMSRPPWDTMPVLTHGAGGDRTDLVCGHLHSEDPLFDPAMRALPPVFVVRVPDGPAARWVPPASTTRSPSPPIRYPRRRHRRSCQNCCSPRCCDCTSRRPRWPSTDGSLPCRIRCWRRPWHSCTPRRNGNGPSPNWPAPWPFPARCSTNASAMSWAVRRSDTSPNGACTSPTTFSAPPNSASPPSRDAPGTSPRRRSVAPSGEATAAHPAPGEPHSSAPRDTLLVNLGR